MTGLGHGYVENPYYSFDIKLFSDLLSSTILTVQLKRCSVGMSFQVTRKTPFLLEFQ